jgi:hypothetical protein
MLDTTTNRETLPNTEPGPKDLEPPCFSKHSTSPIATKYTSEGLIMSFGLHWVIERRPNSYGVLQEMRYLVLDRIVESFDSEDIL